MFLLWGIDKIVASESTVKIFSIFYKLPIGVNFAIAIGIIEVIFALVFISGVLKRWTYGLGLLFNIISIGSTYKQLLSPFGKNHLFIAGIPILAASFALYMLRDMDTFWTLSKNKK